MLLFYAGCVAYLAMAAVFYVNSMLEADSELEPAPRLVVVAVSVLWPLGLLLIALALIARRFTERSMQRRTR